MYHKILGFCWNIFKQGLFDDNAETSLMDELKAIVFPTEGTYANQIQKVLSAQSSYRLGKYTENSFGEVWTIIKPLQDKMQNLDSLKSSIQDSLSKMSTQRTVDFLKNPFRLVLYYKKPKTINFSEVEGFISKENRFYPVVYENKLCSINPEKEEFSHCLISGITGSGKTVLLKNFIGSLKGESLVYFCNPKNDSSFVEIESLCTEYKVSLPEIEKLIETTWKQTEQRLQFPNNRKLFLFVDELSLLSKEAKDYLTKIANVGRSLGVHLILATQRPTKETLPTELKSQLTYSLTGRVTSKREAFYASGVADSGAENLQGSGLFLLNASGYNNLMVQALFYDSKPERKEGAIMVEVYDYTWDNAPRSVLSRKDWLLEIEDENFLTLKELQQSHEKFYSKKLNHKTAKQIKEWLE